MTMRHRLLFVRKAQKYFSGRKFMQRKKPRFCNIPVYYSIPGKDCEKNNVNNETFLPATRHSPTRSRLTSAISNHLESEMRSCKAAVLQKQRPDVQTNDIVN